jgi:hypothetical protein
MGKRKEFLQSKLSKFFKPESRYLFDITDEFKEIRFKVIKNSINYNLKSLNSNDKVTIQVVCVWIRNYIEFIDNNKYKL